VATSDPTALEAAAAQYGVEIQKIAVTNDRQELKLGDGDIISNTELRGVFEHWLPALMESKPR
jgi:hypothetical protein